MADQENNKISFIIKFFSIIIAIVILIVSRYAFVFFIIAMLPAIIALTIDKKINRYASSTVCAFNLIGVMPFIFNLLRSPIVDQESQIMITNSIVWFSIYGSTSLGWIMIWGMPKITSRIFIARTRAKIKKINDEQNKIIEEWGLLTDDI